MKLNDEVLEMKKEVREMKEQSIAMEIVKNQKKTIKNIIVAFTSIIIVLLVLFGVTIAAFLHYINTTGYEEETINTKSQEIEDVDTYVKMAYAWLDDVDAKEHKVWKYFIDS